MKVILLSSLILSFNASAFVKKATIDEAFSVKYDENYKETQRKLASKPTKEEMPVEKETTERVPSNESETMPVDSALRFWKY